MLKPLFNYPKRTLAAFFLFIAVSTQAQYHAAIGVKGAKFNSGISAKYFFWPDNATGLEVVAGHTRIAKGGWFVTALYEITVRGRHKKNGQHDKNYGRLRG